MVEQPDLYDYNEGRKEGNDLRQSMIMTIISLVILLVMGGVVGYLVYLIIKALKKYINSGTVRKEKSEQAKTLGEVIKKHRVECKMTQEFVAEALGVSREAVSKWESGISDPSTTNLMALAKLFGVDVEDMLKEVNG